MKIKMILAIGAASLIALNTIISIAQESAPTEYGIDDSSQVQEVYMEDIDKTNQGQVEQRNALESEGYIGSIEDQETREAAREDDREKKGLGPLGRDAAVTAFTQQLLGASNPDKVDDVWQEINNDPRLTDQDIDDFKNMKEDLKKKLEDKKALSMKDREYVIDGYKSKLESAASAEELEQIWQSIHNNTELSDEELSVLQSYLAKLKQRIESRIEEIK